MSEYLNYEGLKYYDSLIKKHLESVTVSFNENEFIQIPQTNFYYIEILASAHNFTNPYVLGCYDNNKSEILVDVFIFANKTIRITTNTKFTGIAIIKQSY